MNVEELKPDDAIELKPLSFIKHELDKKLGGERWEELEIETISLELGLLFSPLTVDKITVLQTLLTTDLFYDDPLFFIFAIEVINNNIANFAATPLPTSLEIAYAIKEAKKIKNGEFNNSIKHVITYILKQEGYSKVPREFKDLCYEEELHSGQELSDMADKEKAIQLYLEGMENGTDGC